MDERIDRLLALAERQHATIVELGQQIGRQTEHIGLLVQSVALLLGEEIGAPASEDEEPQRLDMDGKPY
ncbi:hypothetical protein [Stenotrophomonas sp. VV52]|uniref:hypothetical protein n=1 Tax=Stenotrophomonas sp. VV52 TaxID=2066958 RepID=UPI000C9EA34E|nr:hypothetical protein [Stenotrophomonas sp. VV52]